MKKNQRELYFTQLNTISRQPYDLVGQRGKTVSHERFGKGGNTQDTTDKNDDKEVNHTDL